MTTPRLIGRNGTLVAYTTDAPDTALIVDTATGAETTELVARLEKFGWRIGPVAPSDLEQLGARPQRRGAETAPGRATRPAAARNFPALGGRGGAACFAGHQPRREVGTKFYTCSSGRPGSGDRRCVLSGGAGTSAANHFRTVPKFTTFPAK